MKKIFRFLSIKVLISDNFLLVYLIPKPSSHTLKSQLKTSNALAVQKRNLSCSDNKVVKYGIV